METLRSRAKTVDDWDLRTVRDIASDFLEAWQLLESAAWHFGELWSLRYDGLGSLARRLKDAFDSTEEERRRLVAATDKEIIQEGSLTAAVIWPELGFDAMSYGALASIYLREGPLDPFDREWWRRPSRRESREGRSLRRFEIGLARKKIPAERR